jgi:chemotaxis protein methyltransferase WspC
VKRWLAVHAGLDADLMQRGWFDRHIAQRLQRLSLADEHSYCALLERDAGERERLIAQVSVGETWFFRYPESFALLVAYLAECLSRGGPALHLRMLSLACATGEEPYSMAAAALEAGWPAEAVTIDAVDRNPAALAKARRGPYSPRALRRDAPTWAHRWLRREEGETNVAAEVRKLVRFEQADVLEASDFMRPGNYVAVFCRNLLIYLHPLARERVVFKLRDWLRPGGLLFVGHAEPLKALRPHFEPVDHPGSFALRRVETPAEAAPDLGLESAAVRNKSDSSSVSIASQPRAPSPGRPPSHRSLSSSVDRSVESARPPQPHVPPARGTRPVPLRTPPKGSAEITATAAAARRLADAGALDDAVQATQAALEAQGPSAELFHLLGSVQMAMGELEPARDAFRKAVYLDPLHEESLLQLAMMYQNLGDEAQAAGYRKRAARAHRQTQRETPS